MSIKTLFNRVLAKPQVKEQKTASGLIMPTTNDDNVKYGVVKHSSIPIIQEGSTVIFPKNRGTELLYGGEAYIILSENDILAIEE